MFNIFFADNGIRTADLRCQKRPLSQLSHNHGPFKILILLFIDLILRMLHNYYMILSST